MALSIEEAFKNLKIGEIKNIVESELAEGADPYVLIRRTQDAMEEVGKKFETGDYYMGELMLSARMFEIAVSVLEPLLKANDASRTIGKIVLGTPKGDVHDLGKNIFKVMAQAGGFEVIDLGIDVPAARFVEAVKKENPQIVGMSALLTTTYPSMVEVVKTLEDAGMRNQLKIIIGGGATGEEARRYVGADAQTLDASKGVRICRDFMQELS
ncbi:MAG: cobalamin B12-binding domain-containing protein [Syntrophales bacterium]